MNSSRGQIPSYRNLPEEVYYGQEDSENTRLGAFLSLVLTGVLPVLLIVIVCAVAFVPSQVLVDKISLVGLNIFGLK